MRVMVIVAVLFTAAGAALATPQSPPISVRPGEASTPVPQPNRGAIQTAQDCGWFAILGCFRSRGEAQGWNDQIDDGYVVNTTSARYPNFQPGYYCVVNGPTSNSRAQRIAAGWRRFIPDAYVKNSC